VSLFGSAFAPIALAFAVLDLTGSASDFGLVVAAGSSRKSSFSLSAASEPTGCRVTTSWSFPTSSPAPRRLRFAALVLAGIAEIWHLVVLQVVRGVATSFFSPASQGIVPEPAGRDAPRSPRSAFAPRPQRSPG
jgi:hypothetical protein